VPEKFDRGLLARNYERAVQYHARLLGPDGLDAMEYLEGRGIEQSVVELYWLGLADGLFDGWISIPYIREPHGVAWFNYRNLDDPQEPKYKAPGAKHLYNTAALEVSDSTGSAYITEGEFDAIVATEMFDLPAVGVPGATQWQGNPHWRELFRGYEAVYVLADPDDAGMDMAAAIAESLPSARVVKLPADVSDCWLSGFDVREAVRG
jgi:DNA primase